MKTNDFKYFGPSQIIFFGLENNQILELSAITFKASFGFSRSTNVRERSNFSVDPRKPHKNVEIAL